MRGRRTRSVRLLIKPFVPWIRIGIGRLCILLALFHIGSHPVCGLLLVSCALDTGTSGNGQDAECRQYDDRLDIALVTE
jgi:hypothetical protein